MPSAPSSRLVRTLVAAASVALVIPLLSTTAARADGGSAGGSVTGTVTRAFVEHRDQHDATARQDFGAPLTWIRPADGSAPVRVPTSALADVPVGATVKATIGGRITDSASVDDGLSPAKSVLAASVVAAAPAPAAPQTSATVPAGTTDTVTVALVAPAGSTPDTKTVADVVNAVNGPAASFWDSQSGGAIKIAVGDSYDWWTASHDCSNPEVLWNEVAQHIGWTRGPGKHLLLYVPARATGCAYGLAEVGPSLHAGGYAYVTDTATSVVAHELGHNFGLLHSGTEECETVVEDDPQYCDVEEYGDLYDVMGASWTQVGSLNAAQSARLGLLPGAAVQRVDVLPGGSATVVLSPLGGSTGTRAIQVVDQMTGTTYYLEYRTPVGQDASILGLPHSATEPDLTAGVLLRRVEDNSDADSSMLLDGTPSSGASWYQDVDPTLAVGRTVHVPGGDVDLTLTAQDASTATVQVVKNTSIDIEHAAAGGDGGPQGPATAPTICDVHGCSQVFTNATVYWSAAGGAHAVGTLMAIYAGSGGPGGPLGYPLSDDYATIGGGVSQLFANGGIHWSPTSGGYPVVGAIAAKYDSQAGESGPLSYPVSDQYPTPGGGWTQAFAGGSIHWSPATGAHVVRFPVKGEYDGMQGESGVLGYPVTDQYPTPLPGYSGTTGYGQLFQNGGIHYSPLYGAHAVYGTFAPLYDGMRGESGPLGYPRSDPYPTIGYGWSQAFASGGIHWSPASGVHSVYGTFSTYYDSLRGELSPLGYPVSEPYPTPGGGWSQAFQYGGIHWAPGTPVMGVVGPIGQAYDARRGESGPLGYPTSPQYGVAGGIAQNFQHGTITVAFGRTTVSVR